MCGRYANTETIPAMRKAFQAAGPEVAWAPSWNICPTRSVPVLLGGGAGRRIGLMRWGWNPPALDGRLLINCRGEEAHRKRMFLEPFARRRCVVPATAFYEWQPAAAKSARPQPYAFVPEPVGLWAIGALWEPRPDPDGRPGGAVILLTVPANERIAPVHDRMPMRVLPEHLDAWLDPSVPATAVQPWLAPSPAAEWRAWPIGRGISDVHRDDPGLAEPITI
jgi:putative SOS response-associated peptidase YedK